MATAVNSSFSTNFWGQDDRGSEVVINKMNQGAQTLEELLTFMKERIQIEEDYSRRMMNLSKRFQVTGIYETGQMRASLDSLKYETEQMSQAHFNQSRKFKTEIYEKMDTFLSDFKAKRKPIETSTENIAANKKMMLQKVTKLKEKYQTEVTKLNSYLAQESLLLGKELDKNRDKIYKQQQVVSEIRSEYSNSCLKLEEINKVWIQEWRIASSNLQFLEMERIEFIIKELWEYSNLISTSCVNDDSSCESLRKSLETCEPLRETNNFVSKFQTGSKIYSTPGFVDFMNGESNDDSHARNVIQNFKDPDTRSTSAATRISAHSQHSRISQPQHPQPTSSLDPHQQNHQYEQEKLQQKQREHALKLTQRTNLSRRPPPSDDGQTSISNPSFNSISTLHREESAYSNPTSISSFAESVDHDLRSSQNWNSPSRRRSRTSEQNGRVIVGKKSTSSNRRSFFLDDNPKEQFDGQNPNFVDLSGEDPLRATLEDLKIGGNGDTNKFKEYIATTSTSGSTNYPGSNKFASSTSSLRTNDTTIRPKSMIVEAERSRKASSSSSSTKKRSSFHEGLRSQSKSSINLQAKLSHNGYPSTTRTGRRVLKHAKALFDFSANIEGELSFKENDILLVYHIQEDGWWECENMSSGLSGLAPYNYLEKI